jgi:hypothetical protein
VVAAGNVGGAETIGSPGTADAGLTMGSVSKADVMSDFSSRGTDGDGNSVSPVGDRRLSHPLIRRRRHGWRGSVSGKTVGSAERPPMVRRWPASGSLVNVAAIPTVTPVLTNAPSPPGNAPSGNAPKSVTS